MSRTDGARIARRPASPVPNRWQNLVRDLARFTIVGGVGFVVDVALFNLLLSTVLSPAHSDAGPIIAKTLSTGVAIAVNWVGNRWWTFRTHRRADLLKEGIEFAVVSAAGSAIAVGCLAFSHYVLDLTTPLADNISANVIGLALGSLFRFTLYRHWVFSRARSVTGRADRIR